MTSILPYVVVVLLLATGGLLYVVVTLLEKPAPLEAPKLPLEDLEARASLAQYELKLDQLTLAVAEGISNVKRAESRIRAVVQRAREELTEHGLEAPGLEAEYEDLRVIDGGGGEESRLPAMPSQMDEMAQSSVPGVTPDQLLKARGFR